MELERKYIHKNETIATTFYQTTLDDDYNLADYKPDIMKMIRCRGRVVNEEIKVGNQCVFLAGKMVFEILYRGETLDGRISSLKGEIPYREKVNMEGVGELDSVDVCGQMLEITVNVINSRKLNIRAIADFTLTAKRMVDIQFPIALHQEEQYEVLKSSRELLQLGENKKDVLRIRTEVSLPKEKPNGNQLIWSNVCIQEVNTQLAGSSIELKGMAYLAVLYEGTQESPFEWYETTLPVEGSIECQMGRECDLYQARILSMTPQVELREDLDGEMRSIALEVNVEMELSFWKEEEIQMLEDVYSLSIELEKEERNVVLDHLLMKNEVRCKLSEEMTLDEMEEAMYLCGSEGTVVIDEITTTDSGVHVQGKLVVDVLYITTDDAIPVASARKKIPFTQELEVMNLGEDHRLELEARLGTLQVSLSGRNTASVRGEVQLNLMAFAQEEISVITSLAEKPRDMDRIQESPGMTGYIVGTEDTLWKIAKENHTTVTELVETNQLGEGEIYPGQKLLIVKKVANG